MEAIHQKRLNTILYNNPFGIEALVPPQASSTNTRSSISHQWRLLYNLATDANLKPNTEGWMTDNKHLRRSLRLIDPIVKLQIAIRMREETTSDWLYKYRPQHFIYGEFCMVLTKPAFRIASRDGTKRKMRNHRTANKVGGDVEVVEIPLSAYNPDMLSHVVAREIAFGPDCDPSVRGVSLWFHIDEEDVTVCTPQQAKRFRWKKGIKPNKNELDATDQNRAVNAGQKPSAFDSQAQLESFPMLRPQDPDAYDLVTDILKHRLAVLRAERICSMKERFESLKHLESKKCDLQLRFEHMQRTWTSWAWPVNIGREFVDRRTPVPAVDGFYKINDPKICSGNEAATSILIQNTGIVDDPDNSDNIGVQRGTIIPRIWTSFVATISPESLVRSLSWNFS